MRTFRLVLATLAALAAAPLLAGTASAAIPANTAAALKAVVAAESPIENVCRGCGCRGGAGYRLPSGKCAPRR